MHVPDPLSRAPSLDDGLNLRAPASKPPSPEPSVESVGDAQMPVMPMAPASDFDSSNAPQGKEAASSEVGNVGPDGPAPTARARTAKRSRGGARWDALPPSKNASDTATHDGLKQDVTRTPPTHRAQDAESGPIRGGHRDSFPSTWAPQSRSRWWSRQRYSPSAAGEGVRMEGWEK